MENSYTNTHLQSHSQPRSCGFTTQLFQVIISCSYHTQITNSMVVFIWSQRFGETAKMRYEMFQLKIEMLLKCTDTHTFSTTAITFSGMIFLRRALKWAFNHLIVYINGDWMWRCQALTMAILLACVSLTLSNDKSIIRGWKKKHSHTHVQSS